MFNHKILRLSNLFTTSVALSTRWDRVSKAVQQTRCLVNMFSGSVAANQIRLTKCESYPTNRLNVYPQLMIDIVEWLLPVTKLKLIRLHRNIKVHSKGKFKRRLYIWKFNVNLCIFWSDCCWANQLYLPALQKTISLLTPLPRLLDQ